MTKRGWLAWALLGSMAAGVWAQQSPNRNVQERREPLFRQEQRGKKKDKDEDANTRAAGGVVRNEADQPVDGAVVQLKDTKTLRIRSYITKADGQYRFYGLSLNVDYELRADFKETSSDTKTLSLFDTRKQAVINLKLDKKK